MRLIESIAFTVNRFDICHPNFYFKNRMNKKEIAHIFEEIAMLLELKAANPFRIRAYRNAARALLNMDEDLLRLIEEERLTELEGIGNDLADKITTLALKGHLPFYEKLKRSIP